MDRDGDRLRIVNVVGARPNFMKVAPIYREMKRHPGIEPLIVHTGQHYDRVMSELFFTHLGLPRPDVYLGVGSGSHGTQTGTVMIEFEAAVADLAPDLVLVVGDVNSTVACALVATKMGIPVAHVEAGLRSFDRTMPEEINRLLTDQISEYLFTTEDSARRNLVREGVDEDRIFFVGNVMIDSLLEHREKAARDPILDDLGVEAGNFVLVTFHRPSNVDSRASLEGIVGVLAELSRDLPVLFPVHPRTRARLSEFGLEAALAGAPGLRLLDPLGYLSFLRCMDHARLVITDSGGIQEETTVLGVPCITARNNTERPVTVEQGTNEVVGEDPARIREAARRILSGGGKRGRVPELWDGHASRRIVEVLLERAVRRANPCNP